jgi:hypothetical protein
MKRALVLILVAAMLSLVYVTVDAAGRQDLTFNSPGRHTISNGIDYQCNYGITCFTISPGFTARNFRMDGINPGTKCTTGGIVETKSFLIRNVTNSFCANPSAPVVYSFSETAQMGTVSRSESMPISSVVLGPGTYELVVGGGANAGVTVSFDLTSP